MSATTTTRTAKTAVILVPGFFGFGTFGRAKEEGERKGTLERSAQAGAIDPTRIQYFARVADVLKETLGGEDEVLYIGHEPSPTGPLVVRATELHEQIKTQLAKGVTRVHLIGHSTGGVDARLVANRGYALPNVSTLERDEVISRIASIMTVSAPFHGAPVAEYFDGRRGENVMMLLSLLSVLTTTRELRLTGRVALLAAMILRRFGSLTKPEDLVIPTFLAGVDPGTATQIQGFLAKIISDHRALFDLSPAQTRQRGEHLTATDHPGIRSFVTSAPRPPGYLASFFSRDAPLLRMLYAYAYRRAMPTASASARAQFPKGPWIGGDAATQDAIANEAGVNDGVVPAASQTIDGRAEAILLADHLDVVGHYDDDGGGGTFFKSGAAFDDARFREFWTKVATTMQAVAASSLASGASISATS